MSISTFASKFSGQVVIATLLALLIAAPAAMKADTYQIYNLGTDAAVFFYGMDDSGAVVLTFSTALPCQENTCYKTFVDGDGGGFQLGAGYELNPPPLAYDNGGDCTPVLPPGAISQHAVCNNGREAFSGFLTAGQQRPGIYTGSDSALDPLTEIEADSGEGPVFMNSLGDIVWDDYFSETFMEAVDLTTRATPEPASIALVGTGILAALGSMRRKRLQK